MNPLETSSLPRTEWGWGRPAPEVKEVLAFRLFPWKAVYAVVLLTPYLLIFQLLGASFHFWTFVAYVVLAALLALPTLAVGLLLHSHWVKNKEPADPARVAKFLDFRSAALAKRYEGRRVPILELYEAYFRGDVDVKGDVLTALYNRYDFADFVFTRGHVDFFLGKLIPELLLHSRAQDIDQVTDHYDRGNDFYNWFLGPRMVYTSGIFRTPDDTLEQAQDNKLELVCQKMHFKPGEKHLDIGCGWGTMVRYAAERYRTESFGITLAKEQVKWAAKQIEEAGVSSRASCAVMDYRDIPRTRYNKITCLEMAEHVGIKRFQAFCRQVYDLLEDDGAFYLQIAGLRRAWQYEDLMWGVFMGTHVFPGADASCPLGWVVNQVERAGFEVRSVETVGVHYSATIKRWYDNWVSNKAKVVKKYGETWYRKWAWFLAWSVISPEQGSATCYQLVLHKNTRNYNRKQYIAERQHWNV